jgi:hypothetical protein
MILFAISAKLVSGIYPIQVLPSVVKNDIDAEKSEKTEGFEDKFSKDDLIHHSWFDRWDYSLASLDLKSKFPEAITPNLPASYHKLPERPPRVNLFQN